jgi:biotin carboxyl carrier protein
MDLTNEDVTDILALLDSLPYDELDLQTPRFRLTLRRTADGWTSAVQTRVAPTVVDVASEAAMVPGTDPGATAGILGTDPGATAGILGTDPGATAGILGIDPGAAVGILGTGPMEHQAGYNRPNGPSGRLEPGAGGTGGVMEAAGVSVEAAEARLVAVRAPLPGTFYRAPRPGAAPFVEVGGRVGADTVVGIVETMKLFNSVTAGVSGTVAEICLPNGEFADRGATLLRIRAD